MLLAGCGKDTPSYTLAKSSTCLRQQPGLRLGGQLDFGQTQGDADNIDAAYRRFHASNVGIDDVLRRQGNAVMLWQQHPSDDDLATLTGCLK